MSLEISQQKAATALIAFIFFIELSFPHASLASSFASVESQEKMVFVIAVNYRYLSRNSANARRIPVPFISMPANYGRVVEQRKDIKKIARTHRVIPFSSRHVVVTAYSSTPDQTDGDPCTTANGFNVCKHNRENIIAANFLPFGTRVKFSEMFGDREFVVSDRMNKRFSNRVDIWMKTRKSAKQFGVKRLKIDVISQQIAIK